jgi:hypothetical protein
MVYAPMGQRAALAPVYTLRLLFRVINGIQVTAGRDVQTQLYDTIDKWYSRLSLFSLQAYDWDVDFSGEKDHHTVWSAAVSWLELRDHESR